MEDTIKELQADKKITEAKLAKAEKSSTSQSDLQKQVKTLQDNQKQEIEQLTSQLNLMAEDLNKQKKENS